jgi:hypothetical protein
MRTARLGARACAASSTWLPAPAYFLQDPAAVLDSQTSPAGGWAAAVFVAFRLPAPVTHAEPTCSQGDPIADGIAHSPVVAAGHDTGPLRDRDRLLPGATPSHRHFRPPFANPLAVAAGARGGGGKRAASPCTGGYRLGTAPARHNRYDTVALRPCLITAADVAMQAHRCGAADRGLLITRRMGFVVTVGPRLCQGPHNMCGPWLLAANGVSPALPIKALAWQDIQMSCHPGCSKLQDSQQRTPRKKTAQNKPAAMFAWPLAAVGPPKMH